MAFGVRQRISVEEFEALVNLPENAEKCFEFIGGENVEKMPTSAYTSKTAAAILVALGIYLKQNPIGHLTGADGGYQVLDNRYAPAVGYLSKARQVELDREGYNHNPPDLAVEVVSTHDKERLLTIKISNYLAAGTLVWGVYPDTQEVVVHQSGQAVKIFGMTDTLECPHLLPNFKQAVKAVFEG